MSDSCQAKFLKASLIFFFLKYVIIIKFKKEKAQKGEEEQVTLIKTKIRIQKPFKFSKKSLNIQTLRNINFL